MELDVLSATIDRLAASDPTGHADGESMERLFRELTRLEAYVTRATAAFDSSGAYEADGARNAASWLAARCLMPRGQAHRVVRRGRALSHLPGCERAWSDGEITGAHLDTIAGVRRTATAEALQRDEGLLVEHARTLRFEPFTRAVAYWEQFADPDGADARDLDRVSRRDVVLVASFDAMWSGRITLDPISGEIVAGELARLEKELFEADWKEAGARLGREPRAGELARTAAQRRADALVEMAARSRSAAPDGRRPAPLFSVFVGYEVLHGRICELASGTVVSPGSLLGFLDEAYVERAVFGLGRRVEVSECARFFTGATRRAIELRDRRCTHPYCDEPAENCEADHIEPYSQGGATTQENGRMLCRFHNRLRNQRPPPGD